MVCERCGERYESPHMGRPRKYCPTCKTVAWREDANRRQREYIRRKKERGIQPRRLVRFADCRPSGCAFYVICKLRVFEYNFTPYCFSTSKYHKLFVQEYAEGVA